MALLSLPNRGRYGIATFVVLMGRLFSRLYFQVFFLALLTQASNILFVEMIELPHMKKIYKESVRRVNPINRAITRTIADSLPNELIQEAERIQHKAMEEVFNIYKKLAVPKPADGSLSVELIAPKSVMARKELVCQFKSNEMPRDHDWIGVYGVDVPSMPGASRGRWM